MIRFIMLLIIGAIIFMAMRWLLRAAERALMTAISSTSPYNTRVCNHFGTTVLPALAVYHPKTACPAQEHAQQAPTSSTGTTAGHASPNTVTAPAAATADPAAEYQTYKARITAMLRARWADMPASTIAAATADPSTVLATPAAVDHWAPHMLRAAAADMGSTAGLPPAIAHGLITVDDIENVFTMAAAMDTAIKAADAWTSCKDLMPAKVFTAAVLMLGTRGRPLRATSAYVEAAATAAGVSTGDIETLSAVFAKARFDDSKWMPLRLRAGDA